MINFNKEVRKVREITHMVKAAYKKQAEEQFIQDYENGMLISSNNPEVMTLAKKYKKSRFTILRKIKKLNLEREVLNKVWEQRRDAIYQMYVVECKTGAEIAKHYNVSPQRFGQVLKEQFPELKQERNPKNLANYVEKEYLSKTSKQKLSKHQAEEVAEWFELNKDLLRATEGLFSTSEQEDTITHFKGDYYDGRLY